MTSSPIVFLVDVDNTPPDNDAIQQDPKDYLERCFGVAARRGSRWRRLSRISDPLADRL